MSAPGPGSRCRLRLLVRMRIPPVLLFWVIVANLPPPVPKKTTSASLITFTDRAGSVVSGDYCGESL